MRERLAIGAIGVVLLVGCGSSGSAANTGAGDAGVDAGGGIDATSPIDASSDAPPAPTEAAAETGTPGDGAIGTDAADATSGGEGGAGEGGAPLQSIAIPMYMDPSAPDWAQETSAAPTVSFVIANPNSGPGTAVDAGYTQAIVTAHGAGQTIVGYVHTAYGARAIADVEADIDAWYSFYPAIDGIFSDETATDPTKVAAYYAPLYAYVKAKSGKHIVVINPGTPPDESYMTASDIVMSFEDTYANYVTAMTPSWVATYPRTRFWHVVLSATQAEMGMAVALARQRNAGLIYVTDQPPATAYQQLVTGAYWQAELAAVEAP
jgi:hypothetical protein